MRPQNHGNGPIVSTIGVSKIKVITQLHNGERVVCQMTDVLHVPKLTNNLFCVNAATSKGNTDTKIAALGRRTERSLVLNHSLLVEVDI